MVGLIKIYSPYEIDAKNNLCLSNTNILGDFLEG